MKKYMDVLNRCILFKEIDNKEIENLISKVSFTISSFNNGQIIALEESPCTSIGIILKGNVEIQKIYPSGKVMTLNTFGEGNIFGEAIVFSNKNTYPSTIFSIGNTEIMFITRNDIIWMCKNSDKFLSNFAKLLSNRILMLSDKIRNLSYETIRQKVANFLLEEYKKQQNIFLNFPYTRKKMAEILNIPRPSLSRELITMREEGIIDFDKNIIKILDMDLLEECLFD